jgi:effector-binding domain-containing protein
MLGHSARTALMNAETVGSRLMHTSGKGGQTMDQEPQFQERPAQHYAGITKTVTMDGISAAVDDAFPALFGWLAENGTAPSGPPFIRYLVIDMAAELEIELAVPVSAPVTGSGRIQAGVLPAGSYAVLRHSGPYDGLIAANAALQQWASVNGVEFDAQQTATGSAWRSRVEHYLTDPAQEPDPMKWEVDVAYLTSQV